METSPAGEFSYTSVPAENRRPAALSGARLDGHPRKVETKDRPFRYLDLADGGTSAALNKWGQFMQFSRLVTDRPGIFRYISAEPRNILRIDALQSHTEDPDWPPGNPDWELGAEGYGHYQAYPRRHDKFHDLCVQKHGLGLRFKESARFSEPEHYFRGDRWPEVRYTVDGRVDVVIQFFIQDNQIVQEMTLTLIGESRIALELEFEFTTGIRFTPETLNFGPDGLDHSLERAPPEEEGGSQWKLSRDHYYATASLFVDKVPRELRLLGDETSLEFNLLQGVSVPCLHIETLILEPGQPTVGLTSIFRLGYAETAVEPSNYIDISLPLGVLRDKCWNFEDPSSSFIYRRNLETILSQAMPLPPLPIPEDDEDPKGDDIPTEIQPYVFHDHDLVNTALTWSSSLHQALFLLAMDRLLHKGIADESTQEESCERIKEVMVGYIFWLLIYGRECPLGDWDLVDWNGELIPENVPAPTVPAPTVPAPTVPASTVPASTVPASTVPASTVPASTVPASTVPASTVPASTVPASTVPVPTADSPRLTEKEGRPADTENSVGGLTVKGTVEVAPEKSLTVFRNPPSPLVGNYPQNGDRIGERVSEAERPLEPDTSRYEDQLRNCCNLIRILDECSTQFPEYSFLIARVVKFRLKITWNIIEICKHNGSHLWPDRLNYTSQFPYPYAYFIDYNAGDYGGYGGQSIYEYNITLQVLVWRTVKSMKRLLALVPGDDWTLWAAKQSLDEKAIRDRTLESFRDRGTVAGADSGPEPTDRLIFRIAGHERSLPLDQWNCDVVAPSFHEDFFMDDEGKYLPIWAATIRYCDSLKQAPSKRTAASPWESFICFQVSTEKGRRKLLREVLEREASNVGLFANELITHDSRCPGAMTFSLVTHLLDTDYLGLLYPQYKHKSSLDIGEMESTAGGGRGVDGLQGPGAPPQGGGAGGGLTRRAGKRMKPTDLKAEDRRKINDPPSYGEWYWFRFPVFLMHKPREKPEETTFNQEYIHRLLENNEPWDETLFASSQMAKEDFLDHTKDFESGDGLRVIDYRAGSHFRPEIWEGLYALTELQKGRDQKTSKKRIISISDCKFETLLTVSSSLDFQENRHLGEFLARIRAMDFRGMKFSEHTIMPDNLWITEFNINCLTTIRGELEQGSRPNYFKKRTGKFLKPGSIIEDDQMVDNSICEGALGFRIIGDLHDRFWTCYAFRDFDKVVIRHDNTKPPFCSSDYPSLFHNQRKCLEGILVHEALDIVLAETQRIEQAVEKSMDSIERQDGLFNPLLTEEDLSGDNYFRTMNKNSVFYPWILEVSEAIRENCTEAKRVAQQWLATEKSRKYAPRWSENDQKRYGVDVRKHREAVEASCNKLDAAAKNLQRRIDRVKTLKEFLSSELGLREARTSTQLAQTVNLFAVVTIIYLPLTFSTSIVALQDLKWADPQGALIRIMIGVTIGTVFLLMNLSTVRLYFTSLQSWFQTSLQRKMGAKEPSKSNSARGRPQSVEPGTASWAEKRPTWKYWKNRAQGLKETEKRSTLLTDNSTHDGESNWWYWLFLVVYFTIALPVQEVRFSFLTLRAQRVEGAGPLKKLLRLPLTPFWMLLLAVVYIAILIAIIFFYIWNRLSDAMTWLWTGKTPETEDPWEVSLWNEPARVMQLALVAEAPNTRSADDDPEGGLDDPPEQQP